MKSFGKLFRSLAKRMKLDRYLFKSNAISSDVNISSFESSQTNYPSSTGVNDSTLNLKCTKSTNEYINSPIDNDDHVKTVDVVETNLQLLKCPNYNTIDFIDECNVGLQYSTNANNNNNNKKKSYSRPIREDIRRSRENFYSSGTYWYSYNLFANNISDNNNNTSKYCFINLDNLNNIICDAWGIKSSTLIFYLKTK